MMESKESSKDFIESESNIVKEKLNIEITENENLIENLKDDAMPDLSEEKSDTNETPQLKENKSEHIMEPTRSNEWDDVLGSGCVMKKTLIKGKEDSCPSKASICTINYKLMLENETVIEEENNKTVQLGDLEVVQGVEVVLVLMKEGEKCQILIEPRLAFGSRGLEPSIPPNTKVLYEIELIKFENEEEIDTMTLTERRERGSVKRNRGNWWYSRGENFFAIQCYRRALDYLDEVEGGISNPLPDDYDPKDHEVRDRKLQEILEDRINVCNNMAAAQMKLEAYDAALQSLQTVLRCQPNNIKALYRKSKILSAKNEMHEAMTCLNKAKHLEPDNKIILREIQILNNLIKKQKNNEKEIARRMFSNGSTSKNDKKKSGKDQTSAGIKTYFVAVAIGTIAIGIAGLAAWRFKI